LSNGSISFETFFGGFLIVSVNMLLCIRLLNVSTTMAKYFLCFPGRKIDPCKLAYQHAVTDFEFVGCGLRITLGHNHKIRGLWTIHFIMEIWYI